MSHSVEKPDLKTLTHVLTQEPRKVFQPLTPVWALFCSRNAIAYLNTYLSIILILFWSTQHITANSVVMKCYLFILVFHTVLFQRNGAEKRSLTLFSQLDLSVCCQFAISLIIICKLFLSFFEFSPSWKKLFREGLYHKISPEFLEPCDIFYLTNVSEF